MGRAFDNAWEARDRWMQNKITARSAIPPVDLPTTAETMGGLLMGDRAAGRTPADARMAKGRQEEQ